MKYMPRKYREAQSDWFAKRGLPWHITVAIRRSDDTKQFDLRHSFTYSKAAPKAVRLWPP